MFRIRPFAALTCAVVALVATRAVATLPPQPPDNPDCTLYQVSIGTPCIASTRDYITVAPGGTVQLSHNVSAGSFTDAISCGSDACVFRAAVFNVWGSGFTITGDCSSYGGLGSAGGPTRPVTGAPGQCKLRYDPSHLRSPGSWSAINYWAGQGSFPSEATTHLVAVQPEWFKVDVTPVDPIDGKRPFAVFAVRHDANPTKAQCVSLLTVNTWLPNRVVPDCILMPAGNSSLPFENYLPNASWDMIGLMTTSPDGPLRTVATPWTPVNVVVANADTGVDMGRKLNADITIGMELLGGDDVLGLNEDGTVRVTLTVTSQDVVGDIDYIGFSTGLGIVSVVQQSSDDGYVTLGTPVPAVDPSGFSMSAGQTRSFDVPIHGNANGPVHLRVSGGGLTHWYLQDRIDTATLDITVSSDPPPPPERPTSVCGYTVQTYVGAPSTGTTLTVESATGIDVGSVLVVEPCSAKAEQVTVTARDGVTLTVTPSMQQAHAKDAPIVARPGGSSLLRTASAPGATELDVVSSDPFHVGDPVTIAPGTAYQEEATVTGFGSILLDHPLSFAHDVGTAVVLSGSVPAGCTAAATLASVRCRVDALATAVGTLADGKAKTPLAGRLAAARASLDKAGDLLGRGKKGPAKAAIRKALQAINAFAKKLAAKKVGGTLADADRQALQMPISGLRTDLTTLAKTPAA